MNFFARQDQTRRSARRLIVLFALAVIAVVAAIDLVVFALLAQAQAHSQGSYVSLQGWMSAHPGTVVLTTSGVFGVIALASLYKTMVLGGGGSVVARSLGGARVSADTNDALERRLLNVVEEIAIASAVPMPEVYLLEQETGINAFAAGHNPSNAAIGVTRGALTSLNRAELQGVIAHEFSHILNGDMRLNLRLMGMLFGLLVIALIGRTILRAAGHARGGRKGGGAAVVLLVAIAAILIGYVGLFFGRMIQAAVSRAREALADASAVQFTRDPTWLRGALVKIGATSAGSRLANPEVEEIAHMLFAPGMRRLFATHPSLIDRLKAIDPQFDVKEIDAVRARMLAAELGETAEAAPQSRAATLGSIIDLPAAAPGAIAGLVGNPGTAHVQLAGEIRKSLPQSVMMAARHPLSARALMLALALDPDTRIRAGQKQIVARQLGAQAAASVAELERDVAALEPEQRMPTLLRAFTALRQLTREERVQLMACLSSMLQSDGHVSLQSYVLRKLAQVHLRDHLEPAARARQLTLSAAVHDAHVLFSVLAQHGHADASAARRAYEAGMHRLFPRQRPAFAVAASWAGPLDVALSRLDRLVPIAKEALVEAMVETITHDQQMTLVEAELLRAVCATLHCPLPPLMAKGSG